MSARFLSLLGLALLVLFSASTALAGPPVQTELTVAQWREDLQTLATSLRTRHPNPFYKTPEAEFDRAVAELDREIPSLSRDDIVAGLLRISAMIDGHTQIRFTDPAANFHIYPLRLYDFSDGIFAVDATAPYSQVIGARLVQIGDTPIAEAYPRVAPFAYNDNASTVKLITPVFMNIPEVLHAQGLIADSAARHYVFEKPNGERITLAPKPLPMHDYLPLLGKGTYFSGLPKRDVPLMQQQRDKAFWYTELPESNTLYIQFNEVRASTANSGSLRSLVDAVAKRVEEHDFDRIVVDVRHNGGGDNTTYGPLLSLLRDNSKVNQRGKLFLITGRQTFSAAANFSTDVEQKTNAIIAGEPMGGSPNLYGDTRPVTLPHSKLTVNISARTWIKSAPDDPRLTIEPELPVELSSQDYFAKRDPVLEAILAYEAPSSGTKLPAPKTVTFRTEDGTTLKGTLYGTGTTGIVFSNMGAHHQDTWTEMAERVATRGYMGLTYDNRYWTSATQTNDPLRARVPDDLRAAIKFLRTQGAQRIVLVGASLGSMASAKVAAETNPAAVVLMASPVDRTGLPFLVTSDEIRVIASPKLFLVAENDANGFTADVKKMYEMARAPKELEIFPGRSHGTDVFGTEAGDAVMDEIMAFLETHVKLPPAAAAGQP